MRWLAWRVAPLLPMGLLYGCQFNEDLSTWCKASGKCTEDGGVLHSLALSEGSFAIVESDALLSPTGDWTMELWMKDESPAGYGDATGRGLVSKGDIGRGPSAYFFYLQFGYLRAGIKD